MTIARDIGWQIKPYVVVASDPTTSRGQVVRLFLRGLRAQQVYHRLIWDIEKRWEERFGKDGVGMLRESLQRLLARHSGGMPLLSEGLVPPGGTVRAGDKAPALGRRDGGSGAAANARPGGADRSVRTRSGGHVAALSCMGYEPRVRALTTVEQVRGNFTARR